MIDKIAVNSDKTLATVFFDTGKTFTLHHDEGQVMDLVVEFFFVNLDRIESSEEVTEVIDLQLSFDFAA